MRYLQWHSIKSVADKVVPRTARLKVQICGVSKWHHNTCLEVDPVTTVVLNLSALWAEQVVWG